ncbi:MAG: SOS response-associated peptidase family protein [Terriglobales bacterium]
MESSLQHCPDSARSRDSSTSQRALPRILVDALGLIPSWAKAMSGSARMINARSETAHVLPAFREPMKFRRCLIPADGFYEWKRTATAKQPFCFAVGEDELFAFVGL